MSHHKDEATAIKDSLKQIEEYAWENFIPRLREHESAKVEFGEPNPRRMNDSMEKALSFGVNYAGEIWLSAGGLALYFNPPLWSRDRCIYDMWPYAKELILRWPQVKHKMETELTAKENEHKAIRSFSVTGDSREAADRQDFIKVEPILHKHKLKALEDVLQEEGTTVEEMMQEYLLSLYSEKVPFHVQQQIREKIDGEGKNKAPPRNTADRTRSTAVHRKTGGECR